VNDARGLAEARAAALTAIYAVDAARDCGARRCAALPREAPRHLDFPLNAVVDVRRLAGAAVAA
jgi:hypothetical protein